MASDFRPTRIATLATTDNALAGIRAIRNATALTYKFARASLSKVALGANYQIVDSTTVSAKIDRENATPARFTGNSTNGTDGTAAFAIASLSLKSTYSGRQLRGAVTTITAGAAGTGYVVGDILTLVQSTGRECYIQVLSLSGSAIATFAIVAGYRGIPAGGSGYTVANGLAVTGGTGADATFNVTVVDSTLAANLTYASGYALAASEVYKVKVGGALKTVTTDYTVSSANIVFVTGHQPGHGQTVQIYAASSATPLGDEVVVVSVDGTEAELTTDYTIANGLVTFEAAHVPLAGEAIAIWFRTPGTRVYTGVSLTGLDAAHSVTAAISPKVYINDGGGYDAVDAGDFTWTDPDGELPGSLSFDADKIPADGKIVQIRYQLDFEDIFAITGAAATGDDAAPEVWIDATKKTVTTDYTIADRVVTFAAGHEPAAAAVVKVIDVSAAAGIVPAGGLTFFDLQRLNSPAWDYIRAGGSTVVEVM